MHDQLNHRQTELETALPDTAAADFSKNKIYVL